MHKLNLNNFILSIVGKLHQISITIKAQSHHLMEFLFRGKMIETALK